MRLLGGWFRIGLALALLPMRAEAHVKWFAPYDVPEQPRPLDTVLNGNFVGLFVAGIIAFTAVCLFDRTPIGAALTRGIDSLTATIRARTDDWFRAGTGAFFVALFTLGNIILTPELKTDVAIIPWLQAAIALGMFWRSTMALSAAGIVGALCLRSREIRHFPHARLPDLPGAGGSISPCRPTRCGSGSLRPIDVARWAAAITLMWASVEKWAYPQWTYPLLGRTPISRSTIRRPST